MKIIIIVPLLFAAILGAQELPKGTDGKPLNLDFETGVLEGWTTTGEAFAKQPIKGDTVFARRNDMKSEHRGQFWVGSYEVAGDAPTGTLTSLSFKVTQPYAIFLVGGGSWAETRVELVDVATQKAIFKASGNDTENLSPVVADLQAHQGKDIFIRLVDNETGGWGHINFDDFKFYTELPSTSKKPPAKALPPLDAVKHNSLSPEQAATEITVPSGFKVTLFAGEPDVKQPIAFAIDDRGRLWVAESYSYPIRQPEGQGKDRILIFEDTNGDGKYDKQTVFIDNLNLVSGLEVGFGGVWVGAAPHFLFIADKNGDDKPDGPPQVLLDGWGFQDTHETLNTFTWGPDGWLYGCHGVFTHSRVGKPNTPDAERIQINAGIWRYHPTKNIFEVFAEGTSNPWGIDFDENGQCIIEACVVPHLWHIIQGARYVRQGGQHFNRYTYSDIKTIADHFHYLGDKGPHAGNARSDAAGGGHAHAGLMVYLGDNWPAEYRGKVFMNNIHGSRLNMDILEPKGSGFIGRHGADFLLANDRSSQILNFMSGPDGGVFMIDWYDRQQCHTGNPKDHDRSNGRIFKVIYGNAKSAPVNLQKTSDNDLVTMQLHKNEWHVRHARKLLQERSSSGKLNAKAKQLARDMLGLDGRKIQMKLSGDWARGIDDKRSQLRLIWALRVVDGLSNADLLQLTKRNSEYLRAWAIQLLVEDKNPSTETLARFADLARTDPSPVVRLYLASALQRVAPEKRWDILEGLVAHEEDAKDHNLPLMIWYAAEPMATLDAKRALELASKSKIPSLLQYTTRRVTAISKQ